MREGRPQISRRQRLAGPPLYWERVRERVGIRERERIRVSERERVGVRVEVGGAKSARASTDPSAPTTRRSPSILGEG